MRVSGRDAVDVPLAPFVPAKAGTQSYKHHAGGRLASERNRDPGSAAHHFAALRAALRPGHAWLHCRM